MNALPNWNPIERELKDRRFAVILPHEAALLFDRLWRDRGHWSSERTVAQRLGFHPSRVRLLAGNVRRLTKPFDCFLATRGTGGAKQYRLFIDAPTSAADASSAGPAPPATSDSAAAPAPSS